MADEAGRRHLGRRQFLGVSGGVVAAFAASGAAGAAARAGTLPAGAPGGGPVTVTGLRAAGMDTPLGLEDHAPAFTWRLRGPGRDIAQTAYQVQAASSEDRLLAGRPDLLDTGKVAAAVPRAGYGGATIGSRTRAYWRVRVWNGASVSPWSTPSWFETGLSDTDWTAQWVADPAWRLSDASANPLVVSFPAATARYVRLSVTGLGSPLQEQPLDTHNDTEVAPGTADAHFPDYTWRLQLAEMQVKSSADPDTNYALGLSKNITVSETYTVRKYWQPEFLVDGQITTNPQQSTTSGYSSLPHTSADVSARPITITIDLGQDRTFDEVVLYPRTDVLTGDGKVPGFPADFTVALSDDGATFTTAAARTGQEPPSPYLPPALPLFARDFTVPGPVRGARLYVAGLGVYTADLNGARVGDAVLEPANTTYAKRVAYAAYDVTGMLRPGANTIGLAVGNGTANALYSAGRYSKFAQTFCSPRVIAQLEVTLADGRTLRLGTDETWATAWGATTSSNWYGGEDHDARREIAGWSSPGTRRAAATGWRSVVVAGPPPGGPALTGRLAEPIRVAERLTATRLADPAPGVRVYDLGRVIAGVEEIALSAPAGLTFRMYPSESLSGGYAFQSTSNVGAPIWDSYTTRAGRQTWSPRFGYHSMRYVQVTGLPDDVDLTLTGLRVQTDNDAAGSFTCSNDIVTGVHTLTARSVANNMMSILTDCPSREKLGWLEQDHLVFDAVARNFDVAAYLNLIMLGIGDAQNADGMVPSTVPNYAPQAGNYNDEPNWGGAIVRVPSQAYRYYGDAAILRTYYPAMRAYLAYLVGRTYYVDGVYTTSLGDWITSETAASVKMPVDVTGTFGVWAIADGLSQVATVLGETDDAARYAQQAATCAAAIWAKEYDAATGLFGNGGVGATAIALDMGAVPSELAAGQLAHLLSLFDANGYTLPMGEISFPSVLRVLSEAGRDDVVYRLASQTASPSLGYQVAHGDTALGETFDGGSGASQDHFMLGAMDAWILTRLAGIRQAPGSVGFATLDLDPLVTGDLSSASARYTTPYGTAAVVWAKSATSYDLAVTVPAGSTARVHVPAFDGFGAPVGFGAGTPAKTAADYVFSVGSGDWRFSSAAG